MKELREALTDKQAKDMIKTADSYSNENYLKMNFIFYLII